MPVLHNEVLVRRGPGWKGDVTDFLLQMIESKIKVVLVLHKGTITEEELGDQLLVVWQELEYILPRNVNVVEYFIRWPAYLFILYFQDVARNLPDQIVVDDTRA